MQAAFYNPDITYEKNYEIGPPLLRTELKSPSFPKSQNFKFLDFAVSLPFGIPPGPLLNSKFMQAAFDWGFAVSTYKTVRSASFPCHPFPNVLPVNAGTDLNPEVTPQLVAQKSYGDNPQEINITNSFGVPSQKPEIWQEDVRKALSYVRDDQLMILSFMGTVRPSQSKDEFVKDFVKTAKLAQETGAKVLEVNLSCPNIGNEGLVCFNLAATEEICREIRKNIRSTPLVLKVGYYAKDSDLIKLTEIASKYAQAIAAINTLQAEVVNKDGTQALPGPNRLKSGICGASIKWAGISMVERLNKIRKEKAYTFEIIGIGGVMNPQDFQQYRDKGADVVQSATGAMWNPYLAEEIAKTI